MVIQKIIQGDCLEEIKKLENNSIDVIITDPPYNVLALEWDKQEIEWEVLTKEYYRVLKVNGCIYVFGQMPMINNVFFELSKKFKFKQDLVWYKNRGFSLVKTIFTKYHENILFFVKGNEQIVESLAEEVKKKRKKKELTVKECQRYFVERIDKFKYYEHGGGGWLWFETGRCPTLEEYELLIKYLGIEDKFRNLFDRPTFNFEDIKLEGEPYKITRKEQKVYGMKSNMGEYTQINDGKRNPKTVLEYPIIQRGKEYVGHPTQKPIALLKYLINSCSNEGDVILDTFAGSFSTLVACAETRREGIGIELDEKYCEVGRKRLQQEVLDA